MIQQVFKILVLLALVLTISCDKDDNEIKEVSFESYRYELWKKLIDNGYNFDLIGTKTDKGNYPDYLGKSFDKDHEGTGGIGAEGVLNNLNDVLEKTATPDIVLLGTGINDLINGNISFSEIIANVNQIIDVLQNKNPNITIFIEQIAPARVDVMTTDLTNKIESYNNQINLVSANQTDSNSTVISVDMYTNFLNTYFADELHYNKQGAQFVANKYLAAIKDQFSTENKLNILPLGNSRVEGNRQ